MGIFAGDFHLGHYNEAVCAGVVGEPCSGGKGMVAKQIVLEVEDSEAVLVKFGAGVGGAMWRCPPRDR